MIIMYNIIIYITILICLYRCIYQACPSSIFPLGNHAFIQITKNIILINRLLNDISGRECLMNYPVYRDAASEISYTRFIFFFNAHE